MRTVYSMAVGKYKRNQITGDIRNIRWFKIWRMWKIKKIKF